MEETTANYRCDHLHGSDPKQPLSMWCEHQSLRDVLIILLRPAGMTSASLSLPSRPHEMSQMMTGVRTWIPLWMAMISWNNVILPDKSVWLLLLKLYIMMTSSNANIFRAVGPLCGNSQVPGEFPVQRPVTRSFNLFFDLRLNRQSSKQWRRRWFETPSRSLWHYCNDEMISLCSRDSRHDCGNINWCASRSIITFHNWHLWYKINLRNAITYFHINRQNNQTRVNLNKIDWLATCRNYSIAIQPQGTNRTYGNLLVDVEYILANIPLFSIAVFRLNCIWLKLQYDITTQTPVNPKPCCKIVDLTIIIVDDVIINRHLCQLSNNKQTPCHFNSIADMIWIH